MPPFDTLPRKLRVLLVEDDERSARMLVRLLHADGFDVEVVHDAVDAIARLLADPALDAVVTDYHLPNGDGVTVASHARARHPTIPLVFVTGWPDLARRRAADFEPAPVIFAKPVDYLALTQALRTLAG